MLLVKLVWAFHIKAHQGEDAHSVFRRIRGERGITNLFHFGKPRSANLLNLTGRFNYFKPLNMAFFVLYETNN